jgi:signal transduction histidine kinase
MGLLAFGVFFYIFLRTRLLHIYCWHQLFIVLFIYTNSGIIFQTFPDFSQEALNIFGHLVQVIRVFTTVLLGWAVLVNFNPPKSYKFQLIGLLLMCVLCIIFIALNKTKLALEISFLILAINPFVQINGIYKTVDIPKKTKSILFLGYGIYILVIAVGSITAFGFMNRQVKGILFPNFSDWHLNGVGLSIFVLWVVLNEQARRTQKKMDEIQTLRLESIRAKAEHDLHEERGKLVDILTHELKTPLGTIRFALASLKREIAHQGESIQRVKHIDASVKRMNELIDHAASFIKVDQNSNKIFKEEIFISLLTAELIQDYNDSENFKLFIDDEIPLKVDRERLFLILKNLIENAYKYRLNDEIFISIKSTRSIISKEKDIVYFEVRNTVNINNLPDEAQLFERYYRHPNVISLPGLGIGLSLVQSAVKQMGGTVHYRREDNWVIFSVKFPV